MYVDDVRIHDCLDKNVLLIVDGRMTANLPRRRQLAVYSRCVEPQEIVIYRSSIFSICDILYTVKPVRSTAAASGQKSTVNGNRSHILCGRALVFTVAATAAAVP